MIDYIDCNRRLSPEEHYCLYMYFLSHNHVQISYQAFHIAEELIDQYNRATILEKQRIETGILQDSKYAEFLNAFRTRPWEFEKPVLWADRKKTQYYIRQLNESHAFEVYIDWLFRQHGIDIGFYYGKEQQYHSGETAAGIEIKLDKRSAETGNYYIEYQERMTADSVWVNSGILKDDSTRFYLLGTMEKFVIFERGWLMGYYHQLVECNRKLRDAKLVCEQAHNTSKGFLLFPAASRCGNISVETLIAEFL